jgi:hypothetical protein
MHTALQGAENAIIVLQWCVLLAVVEAGRPGYGEQPVEHHGNSSEVVGRICHADPRHDGPREEGGGGYGHAREEEPLKGHYDGMVLELDPPELQRRPYANEEGGLRTEEERENGERHRGSSRGRERGGEEEGDIGRDQRRPDSEEGALAQPERVEEVGRGEADREDGKHGQPSEVEQESRGGDQRRREARVVRERRPRGRDGGAGPRDSGGRGGGGKGGEGLRGGGGVAALVVRGRRRGRGRGPGGEGRGGNRRRDE